MITVHHQENDMPTAMISGANRGLGLGLTRQYINDGWNVIAICRNVSVTLETLSRQGRLEFYQCDLTDDSALGELAGFLAERAIDVLVNNAGMMAKSGIVNGEEGVQGFGHFDRSLWHQVFDINLFTPMCMAELFAANLAAAQRGRIVTISSMLGSMQLNTHGGLYAYRASKAAVNAIVKSMSIDLADRGIIAVAMHPGWVRTDMGGENADLDIKSSVRGIKNVIDGLTASDSGKFLSYDGSEMPW